MRNDDEQVNVTLVVGTHRIAASMPKPAERITPDKLLPLINQLVDAEVEARSAEESAAGRKISCTKGCAACCRAQPVPITPPEIRRLQLLVANLPDERRQVVMQRFADNVQKLMTAGLLEEYFRPRDELNSDRALEIARRYIGLRLVCPFLENDSCSIYEQRPFVCRQYLVRSDPELCQRPLEASVDVMPLRLKPASATLNTMAHTSGQTQATVPLALLFEYAQRHRSELNREEDAETLARTWLGYLCQ